MCYRRVAMMRNLLAPYEQRPWAQTNWILVRLWRVSTYTFTFRFFFFGTNCVTFFCQCFMLFFQGCGFGYRYTRLPHLLKTKPEDANLPSLQSMHSHSLSIPVILLHLFAHCPCCLGPLSELFLCELFLGRSVAL